MFKRKVKIVYKYTTPWDNWITHECDMTFKSIIGMINYDSGCNIRLIAENIIAIDTDGGYSVRFYEPKSLLDSVEKEVINTTSVASDKIDKRDRLIKYIREEINGK